MKSQRSGNVPVYDDFRRKIRCQNTQKSSIRSQAKVFGIKQIHRDRYARFLQSILTYCVTKE